MDQVAGAVDRFLAADSASWMRYDPVSSPPVPDSAADAFATLAAAEARWRPVAAPAAPRSTGVAPVSLVQSADAVFVHQTRGGVPIVARAHPGAPMIHLAVYARGGAAADPEGMEGLGLLLARTALKGTSSRDALAIANEGELAGGSVTATVGADGLGWGISVPGDQWEVALDLLLDVALRPRFEASALDTERVIALQQLAQLRDDMYRYPTRLAVSAAFAGHPYGRSASGSEGGLAAITTDALRAQHEALVLGGDLVVACTGDVDPGVIARRAAAALAPVTRRLRNAPPTPAWGGHGQLVVEERDKAQTAILMAFPGPSRRDDERFAAQLLGAITSGLGGRFFDELREKRSLAYTVHAGPGVRASAGLFTAYIATTPAREAEAREGLLREFARLCAEPVTADELSRAQRYAIGTHAISRQSPSHVLDDLIDAWMWGTGLDEPAQVPGRLQAVTAADIQALAIRCFDPSRRVEGVVRGTAAVA